MILKIEQDHAFQDRDRSSVNPYYYFNTFNESFTYAKVVIIKVRLL
jgi:hypothetical protein